MSRNRKRDPVDQPRCCECPVPSVTLTEGTYTLADLCERLIDWKSTETIIHSNKDTAK